MKKFSILIILMMFSLVLFAQNKGSGGPDTYGYSWKDSDESGGPTYSWYDISSIGTTMSLGNDEMSSPISLGFTFNYYGNDYTTVNICSNGYLSFTSSTVTTTASTMPNVSEPNNVIAPLWSRYLPEDAGGIYYYYDSSNSRFIVQFDIIEYIDFPWDDTATFQVLLYDTGEIIFQYQAVTIQGSNFSVGIENIFGDDGLQVVYSSPYLTNGLAIEFSAGSTVTYGGDFAVSDHTIDYGNVNVYENQNKNFTVSNLHESEYMTGEITTITGYTISESAKTKNTILKTKNSIVFDIGPNDSIVYDLSFNPIFDQSYYGYINITSTDTTNTPDSIVVSGTGVFPNINVSQTDSVIVASNISGSVTSVFNILNDGIGYLDYSISVNYKNNFPYKGSGGPDPYGYFWKDSTEPDGPIYSWYDISSIGTSIILTDESMSNKIPLGFSFSYYGISYDSVRVCSNGYLDFVDEYVEYGNYSIPNSLEPNGIISGYWSDLNPEVQGNIYYYYDSSNGRFIVQFQDIANYDTTISNTYQMIMNNDGSVELQYKEINDTVDYTVGIENEDGSIGTEVCRNTDYLGNLLAVKFIPTVNWLEVLPSSSIVLQNDSVEVTVTCSNSNLPLNKYYADINISSNDPDTPSYLIPVEYTIYDALSSPTNVITSLIGNTIKVEWDTVPYATSYAIYSSSDPYGTYVIDSSGSLNGESWSTNLTESKKFFYVIAVESKSKIPKTITVK